LVKNNCFFFFVFVNRTGWEGDQDDSHRAVSKCNPTRPEILAGNSTLIES
jgi:hypothetical protein